MRVAIHALAGLTVSVGALVSAGCVEGADEMAIDDVEEEEVGTAQQKIGGEAACATLSVASPYGASTATVYGAILRSPDDKYNPGSTCPNQYIAEFTSWNSLGTGYYMGVDWDVAHINNSTDCTSARLTVHYYGYSGGAWNTTPTGEDRWNGVWSSGACNWTNVYTSGAQPSHSTNTKARAVVFGYWPRTSVSGGSTTNDFKPVYAQILFQPE